MRVNQEQMSEQQMETIQTLRAIAVHLARESSNTLSEESRSVMRELAKWLEERALRQQERFVGKTKAALTRTRLFCLQLERLLEKLENTLEHNQQSYICDEFGELVAAHQQRYLYEDMIGCLRELSTESIDRGQGRQAVMYNEMAGRLETRLECGHIDLNDEDQRAKDEALYAEFRQKLEAMRP